MEQRAKFYMQLLLAAAAFLPLALGQDLVPPYFNIAEKKKVTVNATCGEGISKKEIYCKLVGYDSIIPTSDSEIRDGQICDHCLPYDGTDSDKAHPASNAVDGDTTTWWQSPPISRGLKYNRVTLSIDLQQTFQVAYIVVTMANSPRPGVWALERSTDGGQTWQPWQYFAGNDAECQKYFGIHADEKKLRDDQVICATEFSKVLPIEDGEVYVSLTKGRPSANNLWSSPTLMDWLYATNIRLRLIQTKTMLGHLMSVAQGDKTVTRRYYYSIKEISVGGRCVCNGHAYVCPQSEDAVLRCQCQHNTAGTNCEQCAENFVQKKWRAYTRDDPYECEPCNCNGHSSKCHYDPQIDEQGLSMDIHGKYEGGGVCEECQAFTTGINCETCILGYFRPVGVLPNATDPCQPCDCGNDPRFSGNCAPESGKCECKEAFRGADDCSACADGYYDYPDCKPCDCFANGTVLMENGLPFCVAEGTLQCPCLENFSGAFCDECAEGYFGFPDCNPCECNSIGSRSDVCNRASGQCECKVNYGGRNCDECQYGYYQYPSCDTCDCDPQGTVAEICNNQTGQCMCKEGFGGPRCDRCTPGWFDYPNCKSCECSQVGSNSEICDAQTGQCPCHNNYGGRQCIQCSAGFYGYPDCLACRCDTFGSKGISCDDNGQCNCKSNFLGVKCDQCAPQRYNYPQCEECNCNPDGVTEDFFAIGGCDAVPVGSLCTCKVNVQGRICDTCKPLYYNLQQWNPKGCEDCDCHRAGTIGALGVCDTHDGQCACKAHVDKRICNECKDGFFALAASNGLGCSHCQCDVGGTEGSKGVMPVCDKDSGQCQCRAGIMGRRCDEVQDTFYVPTMHQFQYEIEDGYRRDGSPVRIGYDEDKFPEYSWRGYGSYSQLQDEVLLDVPVTSQSVYRMVLRYTNPNDYPVVGQVTLAHTEELPSDGPRISLTHNVLLPPTGDQPAFVTVSGDKGIYASPFDLRPGQYTTGVKIPNTDPEANDVLVDYFVLLPHEYYEPSILKQDVYEPCLAGETSDYCRHYSYPDLSAFRKTYSSNAERPGGGTDVYAWSEKPELLAELGTPRLASVAKWQPELQYPVEVGEPGKHVLAIVYFTPNGVAPETQLSVTAPDTGKSGEKTGTAYIFDCRYTTLCRQVVTDDEGRVQEFNFTSNEAMVKLKGIDVENSKDYGIDSIVAIPLKDWSLDLVTPSSECVRKDGVCIAAVFPDAPDESVVLPFNQDSAQEESSERPKGIIDNDANLLYVDELTPITDIHGKVPKPGLYVLVAQYYQPDKPTFEVPVNISYANVGEDPDIETLMNNGQFYEAVLPLPTCRSNSGCRSVVETKDPNSANKFNLNEAFHIISNNPQGNPVWLESIAAIPAESFTDDFLQPEQVDGARDYSTQCGLDHFYIDPEEQGFCRAAVISIASDFNGGALECECNMEGSLEHSCAKVGGQCPCKDNIIGRQCTRCKPGFFGYPNCKQCKCPPTAQCNEETGECICAPHVTGTEENPCSQCEENTFGYDPITGCQECSCITEGTINGNMSCSLDSGACYCKENVVGRVCDHCAAGYYQYPDCLQCPCDLRGATQDICNQESAECMCKANVEGANCDTCKEGTFDLQQMNPDGCTNCFCSGKTLYCQSHDRLVRTKVETMEGWSMSSFKISKTLAAKKLQDQTLPNYSGELAVSFTAYPSVDLSSHTLYFKAPEAFLRNQINSYGGKLSYQLTYYGFNMDPAASKAPDVLLVGNGITLLFHSSLKLRLNEAINISAPLDPYYWVLPSGAPIDRPKLMVVLTNLDGVYLKASYGLDVDGQARLSRVALDSAVEVPGDREMTEQDLADQVTSVEKCACPEGYHGYSCEDCAVGFYRGQEGPFGPLCVPCNCNGHADTCHPITGECISLQPPSELDLEPEALVRFCHFRPDLCSLVEDEEHCGDNTTGAHCEKCAEGFFGDATGGSSNDCQSCPCPLPENNFAFSCEALKEGATEDYCECKPNYVGGRCEHCGPGYYGQPEVVGDICKPCKCNGNINTTDPEACDRVTGVCKKCLLNTFGDGCERCADGFFGDAISLKNCQACECNKQGTDLCDYFTGECSCFPGVEGVKCDQCMPDHWGYDSGEPGCTACECSEASYETQCDLLNGQCRCKPGVSGQKCDRCQAGFWNLGPEGCESCGCNTDFAVGGTCDQVTGQCQCLEGVIGMNCDHCPTHWVLVVNETRTEKPEWKKHFDYEEGCFPCSSCVSDILEATEALNATLTPIRLEFGGVESSYFAFRRLKYIENDVEKLMPEIELLNPLEGSRRLQPLENQVGDQQKRVKSLIVDYKLNLMEELQKEAKELGSMASVAVDDMSTFNLLIKQVTSEMKEIADGLGSGVTPEQIKTSVDLGNQWLDMMRKVDFQQDRALANEKFKIAMELVNSVKEFAKPVLSFQGNVSAEAARIKELAFKLEDLQQNSEKSRDMLRLASTLNFRNAEPQAGYKVGRIIEMVTASEANNQLGSDLNREADRSTDRAIDAFSSLSSRSQLILNNIESLDKKVDADRVGLARNFELLKEAAEHANLLEQQASVLDDDVENAKSPASRAIEAANAYSNIATALRNATQHANKATKAAEEASSMSVGVGAKATQSRERTQQLYEAASNNRDELNRSIQPGIEAALVDIERVAKNNKETKQTVEFVAKELSGMKDLSEKLKETVVNATDAENVAHDALASIDARAEVIKDSIKVAKNLMDDSAAIKFAVDATKKALADLETRRPKREAEDVDKRLNVLRGAGSRIADLRSNVTKMMNTLKSRLANVREKISGIQTGISFEQGSHLELQPPPKIEELAINTHIQLYFNVTKSAVGGGKAFLFYLGNVEGTHSKMPLTSTDDFIAAEIVDGGRVKLTVDMGAGVAEVYSNSPITYGQWHQLIVDRRGYYITLTLRSEDGVGEVSEDIQENEALPRRDMYGRPFGAVFNLHKDYSKLFVGGFPNNARIQEVVRSTNMDGQIEGLSIGGHSLGLWNYKEARDLRGALERNKLKDQPEKGLRFDGDGFFAVDRSNYQDIAEEFYFKLAFRAERSNGVLLFIGDKSSQDYAALELKNNYLLYSFNLGGGTVSLEATDPIEMGVWNNVEILRKGRYGEMIINGANVGSVTSQGDREQLSVGNEIYLGGYISGQMPVREVQDINFNGCIEEAFIGPDRIDLSATSPGSFGVKAGCIEGKVDLVTFPAATPGYMQLNSLDLKDRIELSFMFRTSQARALLLYMHDTPGSFYYVSLSILDGMLSLNVFPEYTLGLAKEGEKPTLYNDSRWHSVSILVQQSTISLHIDDYEHFKVDVPNSEQLPLLNQRYHVFLGGVPPETPMVSGASPTKSPFIGCIRDVLVDSRVVNFNSVVYHTGVELSKCVVDKVETNVPDEEDDTVIEDPGTKSTDDDDDEATDDTNDNSVTDDDEPETVWNIKPPSTPSTRYGQCKLPIVPSSDPDISPSSGLRFGLKPETYLEFNKKLKIKRRSDFGIEFKTSVLDGLIFYIADEKNIDFIALFVKNGKVNYGFNCGSGTVYIESPYRIDDNRWHFAEFSRQGRSGKLYVDGNLIGESSAYGPAMNIEVVDNFFLGGLPEEIFAIPLVQKNLKNVANGFVGCLKEMRQRDEAIGKWSKNFRGGVVPCSDKVEPGYFFGPDGGFLLASRRYRVGLDFDITMQIKPRNISGLLLAIQGRKDYLILQMVDGTMTFTVDNGRGPITAIFKPDSAFQFCDGNWHEIHAVKAKNVVTLSVDDIFAQPGIGVPGVSSTDTNHGLFIGGHPRPDRLNGLRTTGSFVGCVKDIVIEGKPLLVDAEMLKGDISSHVCPTI